MGAYFFIESGPNQGKTIALPKGEEILIGNDPASCTLVIDDPSLAQKHLACRLVDDHLECLPAGEGLSILVNEEEEMGPFSLEDGDVLQLGDVVFSFSAEEEKIEEEPVPPEDFPQEDLPQEDKTPPAKDEETTEEEPSTEEKPTPQEEELPQEESPPEEEKPLEEAPPHEEPPQEEPPQEELPQEELFHQDTLYEEITAGAPEKDVLAEIDFDLKESGRWLLKVVAGPNHGAEFSMQEGETYTIGTDPAVCDIVFHDTSVSRQHAKITIESEKHLTIEDLESKNGSFIDGKKIEGTLPLEPSMLITTGTTSFVVYDREGEMHTIISPLLPSIVKMLQEEEEKSLLHLRVE